MNSARCGRKLKTNDGGEIFQHREAGVTELVFGRRQEDLLRVNPNTTSRDEEATTLILSADAPDAPPATFWTRLHETWIASVSRSFLDRGLVWINLAVSVD